VFCIRKKVFAHYSRERDFEVLRYEQSLVKMGDEIESSHYLDSGSWGNVWTNVPSHHAWPKTNMSTYSPHFENTYLPKEIMEQNIKQAPSYTPHNDVQWSSNWVNQVPAERKQPPKPILKKETPNYHNLEKLALAVSELTVSKTPEQPQVSTEEDEQSNDDDFSSSFGDAASPQQNGDKKKKKANIEEELAKQSLFKTELCRSYADTGACRYGHKCQFAHGEHELRAILRHPKYKTEFCKRFTYNGLCPYGNRCRFIHPTPEMFAKQSSEIYKNIADYAEGNNSPRPEMKVMPENVQGNWVVPTSSYENVVDEPNGPIADAHIEVPNNHLPPQNNNSQKVYGLHPWALNRRTASEPSVYTRAQNHPATAKVFANAALEDRPNSSEGRRLSFFQNLAN